MPGIAVREDIRYPAVRMRRLVTAGILAAELPFCWFMLVATAFLEWTVSVPAEGAVKTMGESSGPASPVIRLPPGKASVSLPLQRAGNLLFVTAVINGQQPGCFLVDTGSRFSSVDASTAELLKLPRAGPESAGIATLGRPAGSREIAALSLGEAEVTGLRVADTDFRAVSRGLGVKIDGSLGCDLWKELPFTLDYRESRLTFYARASFRAPSDGRNQDLKLIDTRPLVKGRGRKGIEGWLLMDTAQNAALIVNAAFIKMNPGIQNVAARDAPADTPEPGGRPVDGVRLELLEVLGLERKNFFADISTAAEQETDTLKTMGSVGATLLRDLRLTLDFAGRQIWAAMLPEETPEQIKAAGGNIDRKDLAGYTGLLRAVFDRNPDRVRAWIAAGADVNVRDNLGGTPLTYAAKLGRVDLVETLISNGADVTAKTRNGLTPLLNAVRGRQIAVVKALLQHGALPNPTGLEARFALLIACEQGDSEIAQVFLSGGVDPNTRDDNDWSVLKRAVANGRREMVAVLLAQGANLQARDEKGATVLICAAFHGQKAIVELLIEKGADVNEKDHEGFTVLGWAAHQGHPSVVELLLSKGARPNVREKGGQTPLFDGVLGGNVEVVKALLAGRAEVNARDDLGWTPLMTAAVRGHVPVVKILLEQGADPGLKNKEGRTARMLATEAGQTATAELVARPGSR